jgi:hypothetical protein
MLNLMLDPRFKGLGPIIQYVGKEEAHLLIGEYDKYVLFLWLVHVHKVLNPFKLLLLPLH